MKLPFRASINLALCMGLGLIVLSTAASYLTINALIAYGQQETRTHEKAIGLERVFSFLKTAESLQRRYLLTNAINDRIEYRQAWTELQQALQRLDASQHQAETRQAWSTLTRSIDRRMELMELAVVLREQVGLEAATELVGSDQSRQLQAEIDGIVAQIKASEKLVLEHSKGETRQSAQIVKLLILLGGFLSLGVLSWAIRMIVQSQAKRRHFEQKLLDSEAMSRAVTEGMAEGVVTVNEEGIIVDANSAGRLLFGYGLEDLVGRNVGMLLPARYQMGFMAFFQVLASRPHGFRETDIKIVGQRSDGAEFPAEVSFGDVHVDGRRLFTSIVRDTTESNRIAEALRDSEAQMRQLTETVPALIAYIDKNQRYQFHNTACEEAFGRTREQIENKTILEVVGPELYARVRPHVLEVLAGYSVRYERAHTTPSGARREYVMSYFPRYGENEEQDKIIGFFAMGIDVTELKRMDRMKSEFVSTVSHELRTPLTSIRGSLGLVWGGVTGELPEKAKSLVGIAKNNCERLIRLINDILDSEKIESGRVSFDFQSVELVPLLEQALVANEGFAAQHKVRLVLRTKSPVQVRADSDRLIQVVTNLLSNAIKFSPADGVVQVVVQRDAGRVRVEICDDGPGIPEEFRGRIFQKFSQADASDTRQKGGTGLGLSISKSIIERMDGRIGFTTESHVGTTFFFELPEWKAAPPVTAPMGLYEVARPRVLVVEEDPDVARLIGMMLDKGGFDADMAHSAAQARDYLGMGAYAALAIDIKPPYQGSLALIREIRQQPRTSELPVLVLSVLAEELRLQGDHRALGIAAWLEMPLDEEHLLGSLRRVVHASLSGRQQGTVA